MRWVVDAAAAAWMAQGPALQWDAGNIPKLTKHAVTAGEVAGVFAPSGDPYLLGRIVEPPHTEPRWIALGVTPGGRYVTIIFTRRSDSLRPISCRAMRRNERRHYEERRSEEGEPA